MRGYEGCYKYKRKRKRLAIAISSIILLFAVVVVYIRFVVTPVVKTVAEEKVRALTEIGRAHV